MMGRYIKLYNKIRGLPSILKNIREYTIFSLHSFDDEIHHRAINVFTFIVESVVIKILKD